LFFCVEPKPSEKGIAMTNYLVGYDLDKPDQEYGELISPSSDLSLKKVFFRQPGPCWR
jgi:hypothetical protein